MKEYLFEFLLRMGDNTLVLGHRISEWCGTGPALEEDIALANTALDLIGQATLWLSLAGEVEDIGRDADALAFRRDVYDFRNLLLVEQPNGDFGCTIMRQFLFDAWHKPCLAALCRSKDTQVAAIAEKSLKEVSYHLERSADLVIGLGDGTEESHNRMQSALDRLWPYVGEMFTRDTTDEHLIARSVTPDPADMRAAFDRQLDTILASATLTRPNSEFAQMGGRTGVRHSEHLGHMLAQMQWLQRAYPGASW